MERFHWIRKWVATGMCLWSMVGGLQAQEADYTTWLRQGVEYEVNNRLELSGGLEWRTENKLR